MENSIIFKFVYSIYCSIQYTQIGSAESTDSGFQGVISGNSKISLIRELKEGQFSKYECSNTSRDLQKKATHAFFSSQFDNLKSRIESGEKEKVSIILAQEDP
jgi:hypothetical protein